jgi:hypothetical protein
MQHGQVFEAHLLHLSANGLAILSDERPHPAKMPEANVERMQLSTLHSFAAPLLHRYAAFSPLPRGFRILDWTTERGCAHRDVINLISAQIVHLGSIIR